MQPLADKSRNKVAANLNKKLLPLHLFLSSLFHKEQKNPDALSDL